MRCTIQPRKIAYLGCWPYHMVFIPSTTLGSKSIFWHQFILIRLPGSFLSWVIFVHSCVNPMHHSTCKDTEIFKEKCLFLSTFIKKKRLSLFIESLVYIRSFMSINYSALIVACRKGISIHFTEETWISIHIVIDHIRLDSKNGAHFATCDIAIQTRGLQDCILKCSLNRQW